MFDNIKKDLRAYDGKWHAQGFWVMLVYRYGRWRYGVRPVPLRKFFSLIYHIAFKLVQILTGAEVPCETEIGDGFIIDHTYGVVISGYAKIGSNVRVRSGVVIGLRHVDDHCAPVIGNDCDIGSGAKILGNVRLGNGVRVGANAVIISDFDSGATAVGVPAGGGAYP